MRGWVVVMYMYANVNNLNCPSRSMLLVHERSLLPFFLAQNHLVKYHEISPADQSRYIHHAILERCTGHCQCNKGKRNEGNTLNRTGCRALACTWRPRRPSCRSGGIRDPKARRQAGPHELIRKETKQPQASCRVAEGASQSARSSC